MLSNHTIKEILSAARLEVTPETDKEYQSLADDIHQTTGERLGVNTLKRLLGRYQNSGTPTKSSLNVVARYLGYSDWNCYEEALLQDSACFCSLDGEENGSYQYICSDNLKTGAIVSFRYEPEGRMKLLYLGNYIFKVLMATSAALKIGDELDIRFFQTGCTLFALNVYRNGQSMNMAFKVATLHGGISFLTIK